MRVKARLTNDAIEQESVPPPDFESDPDFLALATLYPFDPLVTKDDRGWYLQATELDRADDQMQPWALRDATDQLLTELNGAALLLRNGGRGQPVRATYDYDDRVFLGVGARIYSIAATSSTTDGLDARSAQELLRLAQREPWVRRVLDLLQHVDHEWVWFDLWRIWDVIRDSFPDRKAFRAWVETSERDGTQRRVRFENSANDPSLGDNRRHAHSGYIPESIDGTVPPPMQPAEAIDYVKSIAVSWINRQYGANLQRQA